nr:hypothetical protein [Lysobacter enzymogenes]
MRASAARLGQGAGETWRGSPSALARAASSSASANALMTLRMVPSTGCASAARVAGAVAHGRGQGRRVQLGLGAGVLGHAEQELGQDRPGIAAGAVDGVVADPLEQFADVPAAPAQRPVQQAAEGMRQIAAGVAVGDREHVDAVERLAPGDDPARAGDQGPAQGRGGQRRTGGGHERESGANACHVLLQRTIGRRLSRRIRYGFRVIVGNCRGPTGRAAPRIPPCYGSACACCSCPRAWPWRRRARARSTS